MSRPRDPWLDNAKMLLITSVVVGHMIAALTAPEPLRQHLYDALYVVHMPAFVLVSGYLSRSFSWTRRHLVALATTVLLPYAVFTMLLRWQYEAHVGEAPPHQVFVEPFWAMWFLLALAVWRLATPVLRAHPVAVPLSVLVALVAPMTTFTYLDFDRVLQFLPFFVVGLHARREWLETLRHPLVRVAAVGVLVVLWRATADLESWAGTSWLFNADGYELLGATGFGDGVQTKLALLALSFVGALAVLSLVPATGGWFTTLGAQTMTVYLAHTVVVQALQYDDAFASVTDPHAQVLLAVVLGVALSLVLASAPVVRALRWVTDPVAAVKDLRAPAPAPAPAPGDPTSDAPRSAAPRRARETADA
ncbi:acyltransferase family protein [Nocardioides alkalitolerans]|uniref:acyltransferase family protein n=1 Tax=Nocardioides alkalitolerans TaxID=281714 RepID=UPI00146FA389|nr:acyltransferase family protein [Nocardioides alkalitolerans]